MITRLLSKILGDPNEKEIRRCRRIVEKIRSREKEFEGFDEKTILEKSAEFRKRIQGGTSLDDILPEAFALVKTACKWLHGKIFSVRGHDTVWEMIPFDVQLIGGIVLHEGKIAEMKTGEGKTLVATLPLYLHALEGKGAYLVTVNEYLAHRDAEWMGPLYTALGLSVGVIAHGQTPSEKQAAYRSDITYGTNNEFGFDYLRDNMSASLSECAQRELHYAIVDEVDSILIDEARTPLIISAPAEESTEKYKKYARLVTQLQAEKHFTIDEKGKSCILTEDGVKNMEELLGIKNIYTEEGASEVHHIEQSLKAMTLFKRDVDYMVKEREVIIIDEFTGRLMPGRRYSEGLHQAIEAKENVDVQKESRTLATITFQNYFRLFKGLAGMTGTAVTEAEEFSKIYGLETIVIPTHMKVNRTDHHDLIYKNMLGKFMAVTKKVKELQEKGQPVLVGTISVEKSEILSGLLQNAGVKHQVLNAKHHEREAEIIMHAGEKGTVTIATNMAGRGTDIKIKDDVRVLGGLLILGTERHESRRIDNQLRGRSGRQGDPGESQFYVSMEDDLMRLFGGDRMKSIMETLKVPEEMPIQNSFISRSIESAQKRVEGHNFDIRKHLVEYDDVMNRHRTIIYARRDKILKNENVHETVLTLFKKHAEQGFSADDLQKKMEKFGRNDIFHKIEKQVYLRTTDRLWMEHIDAMMGLREQVSFRGYAQKDPLIEYKNDGFTLFEALVKNMECNTLETLLKMELKTPPPTQKVELITNEDEIEDIETGSREMIPTAKPSRAQKPVTVSADENQRTMEARTPQVKANRNDPCPCGSGKKYKKCHGRD